MTQSGKATYTFESIGNYGVAIFDANAAGNLSFLSNVAGIYKIDTRGFIKTSLNNRTNTRALNDNIKKKEQNVFKVKLLLL